jgi:hypothetical protein
MSNTKYFESPEEFFDGLQTKEEIQEYIESYEIGGFDMDDTYTEQEYDYFDVDNYGYDD